MAKPTLTKEQIIFWFHRFRKLNINKLEHRRRLINSFVNAIYLHDDKMIITFNYKNGTKTITFDDLEKSGLSSDLTAHALPKKAPIFRCFFPLFTLFYGDFTCFSHIYKTTAHGLFRTPLFHFHTGFYSLCEFIYADLILFGNLFGIIFLSRSSFPSLIASL